MAWWCGLLSCPNAGEGHHGRWFHCSVGTFNLVARQQAIAFTHPYTSKVSVRAGFVLGDAAALAFPADAGAKTIGLLAAWAATTYFQANIGGLFHPAQVITYSSQGEMWASLAGGKVDAVFVDSTTANMMLSSENGYQLIHPVTGWSNGISYGCHPEYGDVVAALNRGLEGFKATSWYNRLCEKFPTIACDYARATYRNVKTPDNPQIMDHPETRAEIVIATEADYAEHNYIRDGVLAGFDIELTKAVCALSGKTCAVVTVPWRSVWAADYSQFGYERNCETFAGEGHHDRWFHCSVGTVSIGARHPAISFSDPYTDPAPHQVSFASTASVPMCPYVLRLCTRAQLQGQKTF